MGVASAITGGLSAGMGIYQTIKGAKEQRDAERALKNYQRQELKNAYENVQVSTLGADLQREEQARLASAQVNALQGAGTRGLVGGLGRVETGNQRVNLGISANLDEQQKAIDQMIAEDNARIRVMQEARENADINALSSQYQSGKQDMNMGIGNTLQGIGTLGNSLGGMSGGKQTTTTDDASAKSIQPLVIPNQGMSMASERFNPMQNTAINPNAFSVGGTGMFAKQPMASVGYGRVPVGYDASGQPIFN